MNFYPMKRIAPALLAAAVVASCGGGVDDNEAGAPQAFNVSPAIITVKNAKGTCAAGFLAEVFVYGGAAPYYLNNTVPGGLVLNKTKVEEAGGSFTITLNGVCMDPGLINVVDKLNKQVTVSVSSPFEEP
jgi:hypothetical protein